MATTLKKAPCLPTENNVAETGFPKWASWLVFGAPKIGKTKFAEEWPKTLIIEMEPKGARYVSKSHVVGPPDSEFPVESLDDLRKLAQLLTRMYNKKERPYETIVLDTIDSVNEWAEKETKQNLNIREMGDAAYGADWGESRTTTLNIIKAFSNLPVNLLILAHSKWAIVNDVAVGHTIDLPGKLSRFAQAAVENIIFITQDDNGERKMVFKPVPTVDAGSRNPLLAEVGECDYGYAALATLFETKGQQNQEENDD